VFDVAAEALDDTVVKVFPHHLDIIVRFQVKIGINVLDSVLLEGVVDLVHHHAIDAFAQVLIPDAHQVQVGAVILL
jgi:hypothetical protein